MRDTDSRAHQRRRGRFLITTWEGGGNVPPALALGMRLRRRGHAVRLMASVARADAAAQAGLDWAPYRRVPEWPADLPLDDDFPRLGAMLEGPDMALDILDELRAWPADVLVADCMSPAAMAAGSAAGVAMAVLVHLLYSQYSSGLAGRDLDTARRALGLDPVPPMPFGEQLAHLGRLLCLTPPGLDAPLPSLPPETFYVGPALSPDPPAASWSRSGDAPVVLVSFSTTLMHQADTLPPVLGALAALPIEGVATLGGALRRDAVSAPANFTVLEFMPHAAILPHASVVVSHGGLSTITSSLAAGVPLICIPQGRDQPWNAERVAAAGVGVALPQDAPPAAIAAAVTAVLEDGRYRAAAAEMAERIRVLGRGEEAARLTEELLDRARPAGPRDGQRRVSLPSSR